jgi:hypothetical protein
MNKELAEESWLCQLLMDLFIELELIIQSLLLVVMEELIKVAPVLILVQEMVEVQLLELDYL